jgi:apolipoprotein D and lipocalin family protein
MSPRRLLLLALTALLQGCAGAPHPALPLAEHVDVERMYGGWYIVATIPNGFEKGLVAPYDVYSARPGGGIREDFYSRRGGFAAPVKHYVVHDWVEPSSGGARWRVQVVWPLALPFLVLYVDPQYRYVLYGEEDRNLGWIYSRTPTIAEADYQALLARFKAAGYDPGRFRKFIQTPDQIGLPGFWNDKIR